VNSNGDSASAKPAIDSAAASIDNADKGEGTSAAGPGWVRKTANSGNKSLMSVDMYANL
jgi:hypothetical protein